MDRRDFLKAAAAAPLVAYLPVEARPGLTVEAINSAVEKLSGYSLGDWYVLIHPQQERDLRDLAAKERWQYAHKAWRKDGRPELSCQQILDKYTPLSEWTFPTRQTAEIGTYEGFRFIESDTPA